MSNHEEQAVIVVENDPAASTSSSMLLSERGFPVFAYDNALEAIGRLKENSVAAVVADVMQSGIFGLRFLDIVRDVDRQVPVILVSDRVETDGAIEAFRRGAFDFVVKPIDPAAMSGAVSRALEHHRCAVAERNYTQTLESAVRRKTRELDDALKMLGNASRETIERLAAVAEYRDSDSGRHVKRIGLYAKVLSEAMGMPQDFVETVGFASILHDIGKVGIPDSILLKPGSLTSAEFEVIRTHTTIGARLLANSSYPGMPMAASIALSHHECWDGKGYPQGLRKEDIPVEGRIVMLADQYDALRSKRPYKPAFSHAHAVRLVTEGDDRIGPDHFDPAALAAFLRVAPGFERIFEECSDDED